MANLICALPLQSVVARVTRLDECGNPEYGACGYAVSAGYASITITTTQDDGEAITQRNANGELILNKAATPALTSKDVVAQFIEVDPELFSLVTGSDLLLDDQDRTIGWEETQSNYATGRFALELWLGNNAAACEPGSEFPYYGYLLLPWVENGRMTGELAAANAAVNFSWAGSTRVGTPWGVGPYDVVRLADESPSPLYDPVSEDAHQLTLWTQLAPPEPTCGCLSLSS